MHHAWRFHVRSTKLVAMATDLFLVSVIKGAKDVHDLRQKSSSTKDGSGPPEEITLQGEDLDFR
jgi:hypothetical protein